MESRKPATGTRAAEPRAEATRFASGVVVLVTLNSPREKFWGAILEI